MGDEDAIFTDRLCHFKLDFWNVTLSTMVENGIRIEPLDSYSRRYLKIYISDMYLGPTILDEFGEVLEETINPARSELEDYRIELSRDKLSQGQHLMIMNTGREIGRFTITGYAKPESILAEFVEPEPVVWDPNDPRARDPNLAPPSL
jgi:hypothetical protein